MGDWNNPGPASSFWYRVVSPTAAKVPANIRNDVQFMRADEDILINTPFENAQEVFSNDAGWNLSNGSRCDQDVDEGFTVNIPDSFVIPDFAPGDTPNNSCAIVLLDGVSAVEFQPFTRCVAAGPVTAFTGTIQAAYDFATYEGIIGSHGGSGLPALYGSIRLNDGLTTLTETDDLHHVLKIEMNAEEYYYGHHDPDAFRWPATTRDDPSGSDYGGSVPGLVPGALLVLDPLFPTTSLNTVPAKIIANTLKKYGARVVDSTSFDAYAFCTERSPDGRVIDDFETEYGFPFNCDDNSSSDWGQDMQLIFSSLMLVTDDAEGTPGGTYDLYSQQILSESPYAYWRMGDASAPITNELGNTDFDLSSVGSIPASFGQSPLVGEGHSIRFNLGALYETSDGIPGGTQWSVEFWVEFTEPLTTANYTHVMGWGEGASGPHFFFLATDVDEPLRLVIYNTGATDIVASTLFDFADDVDRHHVVFTRDDDEFHFYVDGIEGTVAGVTDSLDASDLFFIGTDNGDFPGGMILDEVAFYTSRVLSPATVMSHFEIGSGSAPTYTGSPLGPSYDLSQKPTFRVYINDGVADRLILPNTDADIPAVMSVRGDEGTLGLTASEDSPPPTVDIELSYLPSWVQRGQHVKIYVGYAGVETLMFTGGIMAIGDEDPDFLATQCFANGVAQSDGTKITATASVTIDIPLYPPIPDGQFIDFTRDNPFIWDFDKALEVAEREAEAQARIPGHPIGSPLSVEIHCIGDLHGAYSQYKVPERDISGQETRDAIKQALLDSGAVDVNVTAVPDYTLAPEGAKASRMAASQLVSYLAQLSGSRVQQLRNEQTLVSPISSIPAATAALAYDDDDQVIARIVAATGEVQVPFNPNIQPGKTVHIKLAFLSIDSNWFVGRHRWEIGPSGAWSYLTLYGGADFGSSVGANPVAIFTYSVLFEVIGPDLYVTVRLDASASFDPDGPPLDPTAIVWSDNQTPNLVSGTGFSKVVTFKPSDVVGDWIPNVTITDPTALTGYYESTVPVPAISTGQTLPALGVANLTKASFSVDGEQTWYSQDLANCKVVALRPNDGAHLGQGIFSSAGSLHLTQDNCQSALTEILAEVGSDFRDALWDWRNTNSVWSLTEDARVYVSINEGNDFGLYGGTTLEEALGTVEGTYGFKALFNKQLWGFNGTTWVEINPLVVATGYVGHLFEKDGFTYLLHSIGGSYSNYGKNMWRSSDGGLTWVKVFELSVPFVSHSNWYYGIIDYEVTDAGRIYILVSCPPAVTEANSFDVAPSYVAYSDDHGDTWVLAHTIPTSSRGFPLVITNSGGRGLNLTVSPDGTHIYYEMAQSGATSPNWVQNGYSDDSGATWHDRMDSAVTGMDQANSVITDEVKYLEDYSLIRTKAYTHPRVYKSSDDGANFSLKHDFYSDGYLAANEVSNYQAGQGGTLFITCVKTTSPTRTRDLFISEDYGDSWAVVDGYPVFGQNDVGICFDLDNNVLLDANDAPHNASYDLVIVTDPGGTPVVTVEEDGITSTVSSIIDTTKAVCLGDVTVPGLRLIGGRLGLPAGTFGETPLVVFGGAFDSAHGYAFPLIAVDPNLTNDWVRPGLSGELLVDIASALPAEGLYISAAGAPSEVSGLVIGLTNADGLAPAYYQPPGGGDWKRCVGLPAGVDVVAVMGDAPLVGAKVFRIIMKDGSIHSSEDGINYTETRPAPIETDFTPTDGLFISDILTGIFNFEGVYIVSMEDAGATGRIEKTTDTFVTLNPIWPAGGAFPAWPGGGAKPQRISIGGTSVAT